MLLFALHLFIVPTLILVPAGMFLELDPLYFVFERILPVRQQRPLTLNITIYLMRFFHMLILGLEIIRFISLFLIYIFCLVFTILRCLKELVNENDAFDRQIIRRYVHLSVSLKSSDFFHRHILGLYMVCGQIIMITSAWVAIKCSKLLPSYFITWDGIIVFILVACWVLILPQAADGCEISRKFVKRKTAIHHTFNRYNKNYEKYIRWKSNRMLPVRFGSQFYLGKSAAIKFFETLVTNFTNAALLVNP